jgi:hypothetical protein
MTGTFTLREPDCAKRCDWRGDFVVDGDDGRDRYGAGHKPEPSDKIDEHAGPSRVEASVEVVLEFFFNAGVRVVGLVEGPAQNGVISTCVVWPTLPRRTPMVASDFHWSVVVQRRHRRSRRSQSNVLSANSDLEFCWS